jgi:hypothetical protein
MRLAKGEMKSGNIELGLSSETGLLPGLVTPLHLRWQVANHAAQAGKNESEKLRECVIGAKMGNELAVKGKKPKAKMEFLELEGNWKDAIQKSFQK